jgi:hypothetical protein
MLNRTPAQPDSEDDLVNSLQDYEGDERKIAEFYIALSPMDRQKYARMIERVAAIPRGLYMTAGQIEAMFNEYRDYVYH